MVIEGPNCLGTICKGNRLQRRTDGCERKPDVTQVEKIVRREQSVGAQAWLGAGNIVGQNQSVSFVGYAVAGAEDGLVLSEIRNRLTQPNDGSEIGWIGGIKSHVGIWRSLPNKLNLCQRSFVEARLI